MGYLSDGPTFATVNVNKVNGSFAHSIVIVGAYSYRGNQYISYYAPSCGNRTANYNDMISKSSELELVGLQNPDKDKINSIGGVLK